jgi:hypothetical protein
MNRKPMLAVLLLASAIANAQMAGGGMDCRKAERTLGKPFGSWSQAYTYYKDFGGNCSDGALAELLSGYKTRLLDRHWSQLGQLRRLTEQDPSFLNWVLLSTFDDPEDVDINSMNTTCRLLRRLKTCPLREAALCSHLAERVGPSREYIKSCPKP